jgi:hypothetical protein
VAKDAAEIEGASQEGRGVGKPRWAGPGEQVGGSRGEYGLRCMTGSWQRQGMPPRSRQAR